MGMLLNGIYTPGKPDMAKLKSKQSSTWKHHDHGRQRKDFSSEIVQPYTRGGKPSEAFIDNYPEESVAYGFVKSEAEMIGLDSGTEVIDKGAQEIGSDDERLIAEIPEEYYGE